MHTRGRRALALTLFGLLVASSSLARASAPGEIHYPDLRTLPPSDLTIQQNVTTGQRLLRFSNLVWNGGDGVFELRPEHNTALNMTNAYQRLYTHAPSKRKLQFVSETLIGTFVFHPQHNHWHFVDFALYELHGLAEGGGVGDVVAGGGKVTFCIADTTFVDRTLEHATRQRAYPVSKCNKDANQGLSVGWGDKYSWSLSGQHIDVTGVPDGTYWLVSTADPAGLVLETNDSNNGAAVKIAIADTTVTIVQ